MLYPAYFVTSICVNVPDASTRFSIAITNQTPDGQTTTFDRLVYQQQQFDPFASMTRDAIRALVATHYDTTVDHVHVTTTTVVSPQL